MPDLTPTTARGPGAPVAVKRDPQALLYPAALLAGALILAALLLYVTDRWRRNRDRQADQSENLTSFRAMYEAGEITEAEYKALRDKVAAKLKTELPGGLPRVPPPKPVTGGAGRDSPGDST